MREIRQRNIALCVILSFITCGIYTLYWFVTMTDDMNYLAGDTKTSSGGMALVLTIVTCGIYGWYWAYKMGEKTDFIKGVSGSTSIVYIILQLCGLGIVNYCLIQDTINNKATVF